MKRETKMYVADFETTVYEGQEKTEVWAAGIAEIDKEVIEREELEPKEYYIKFKETRPIITNCIEGFITYIDRLNSDSIFYFHNLKFDISFIMNYFLQNGVKNAFEEYEEDEEGKVTKCKFYREYTMPKKSISYLFSSKGVFYSLTYKNQKGYIIKFFDSFKLLPMSLKKVGESFNTTYQKTSIEYNLKRTPMSKITEDEKDYLKNDLMVLKEGLEIFLKHGYKKQTIASNCLDIYKKKYMPKVYDFKELFPDLTKYEIKEIGINQHDYVKAAYRGAWVEVKEDKKGKEVGEGIVLDVNGLYSYVQHSSSGNKYPVGAGNYISRNIPENPHLYYFVRIKTAFKLKDRKLPWVQIKNSFLYPARKNLTTSDIIDYNKGITYKYDEEGKRVKIEMTLTKTHFELLKETYDLEDLEIIDSLSFYTMGCDILFDSYINDYVKEKQNNTGGKKTIAKLFLNGFYGKWASTDDSSFKIAYIKDGTLKFKTYIENKKKPIYMPIGAATTAYALAYTVRHACKNYDHFLYADTDSNHLDCKIEEAKGYNIDDKKLGSWKVESEFDRGKFIRAKSYIEEKNGNYNITCAGMTKRCKKLLAKSMGEEIELDKITVEEKEFLKVRRTLDDFDYGLEIPSKLTMKQFNGGILLESTTFKLNKN